MRIEIDARPVGPLKVLRQLPAARLAVLEGLNGIGKTLTVRLLQICTGSMPYRVESPAWISLCRGLGRFTIQVSGLKGADLIEWTADTRDWERSNVAALPFKKILIDGRKSSLGDVRALFVAHRVAGDETLIETLAQQTDTAENLLHRWRVAVESRGGPIERLEEIGSTVQEALADFTLQRYEELRDQLEKSQQDVKQKSDLVDNAIRQLNQLVGVTEDLEKLERVRVLAPDVQRRIDEVDKKIALAQGELDDAQKKMVQLARQAARTESVLRELTNAQKALRRNQRDLTDAYNVAAATAAGLNLQPARPAANLESHQLQQLIQELTNKQITLDAAPAMLKLLVGVSTFLTDGEANGLGQQVALDDPETSLQLTVSQTRVGITNRRVQLQNQPLSPEARDVRERLAAARERLLRVTELSNQLISVDRYRRLARTNEARVDKALAAADPRAITELRRLEQRRRERDDELLELAAQRAALRQQSGVLGAESSEVLQARISAALSELATTGESVPSDLVVAREFEQRAQGELLQARKNLEDLRRDLVRIESDVRRITRSFASTGEFGWLPPVVGIDIFDQEQASVVQHLSNLDRLRHGIDQVMDRIGGHRAQLAAVERALRGVGRLLRGHEPEATEYVTEIQQHFGVKFSQWFNGGKIRSELMRDADGVVAVDVEKREVQWTESGRLRSRPLEAFSSGEQAFAYTRARLAVLDEELRDAPNRLIVLDEFGAFIAHDRLSGLLSDLQARVVEHPEDRVLVILPLSHDYAREAENSIGAQRDELQSLANQITDQRFAVRVLAP